MAFWWVNHKQTRGHEVRGGYLWSPMRNANLTRNQTYDNMTLVHPGDTDFSYANGCIGAVGAAIKGASADSRPTEDGRRLAAADQWACTAPAPKKSFRVIPSTVPLPLSRYT